MADRGRKAFPVSSHLCAEKTYKRDYEGHRHRLDTMKPLTNSDQPQTFHMSQNLSHNKAHGKTKWFTDRRQEEVEVENTVLLMKMMKIRQQNPDKVFRPWSARTTFQYGPGKFYDPVTQAKSIDHINLTASMSPRSIHYGGLGRPGSAPTRTQKNWEDQVQADNAKLVTAVMTTPTHYPNTELTAKHLREQDLLRRISHYRPPVKLGNQPSLTGSLTSVRPTGPILTPNLYQQSVLSSSLVKMQQADWDAEHDDGGLRRPQRPESRPASSQTYRSYASKASPRDGSHVQSDTNRRGDVSMVSRHSSQASRLPLPLQQREDARSARRSSGHPDTDAVDQASDRASVLGAADDYYASIPQEEEDAAAEDSEAAAVGVEAAEELGGDTFARCDSVHSSLPSHRDHYSRPPSSLHHTRPSSARRPSSAAHLL